MTLPEATFWLAVLVSPFIALRLRRSYLLFNQNRRIDNAYMELLASSIVEMPAADAEHDAEVARLDAIAGASLLRWSP